MLLVSDELIGTHCPNSEIKYICSKGMLLDEAYSIIKRELKGSEKGPILVSVGSYHVTAYYNDWNPGSIDGVEVECTKRALKDFERGLHRFKKLSRRFDVKISMCSLIPLPWEQDCDNTPDRKAIVTHCLSKLFVKANEYIDEFNKEQQVVTENLKKYMDRGNHNFYMTGQRKIKDSMYNDQGLPTHEASRRLMERCVAKIDSLSVDFNHNYVRTPRSRRQRN